MISCVRVRLGKHVNWFILTIGPDLQLARVRSTLKSNSMLERSDRTVFVLPDGAGKTGNPQVLVDLGLIDGDLGKFSRLFVPFNGASTEI